MTMRTRRQTLGALCLATYMLLLDVTIVQVALPAMQRRLGGDLSGLQWTVDAYALPLSALVITFGTAADRWGRRRVFLAGVAVFSAASLACGLAPGLIALYAARAVQGVAGAAMFATTLALVAQEFTGSERLRAMAAWGSAVGLGVASGPLAGGFLTQALGWRAIFLVNVPIGAVVLLMTLRTVSEGRDPAGRRLDFPGLVALTAGLLLLTAGLLRGSAMNWQGAFGPATVAAGVVLLVGFCALQVRGSRMLDAGLFRTPAFTAVSATTLALGAGMFAVMLFITVYLQNVLGYSPLQGGLRVLPITAPVFLVPLALRRLGVPLVSGKVIAAGCGLAAAGLLAMTAAGAATSWTAMVPGMVIAGTGVGMANPAIAATALAVVSPLRSGLAAGVSNTCRLSGLAVGIALLGALFRGAISATLGPADHSGQAAALTGTGQIGRAAALIGSRGGRALAGEAFTSGLHLIMITGAAITLAGALIALAFIRTTDRAAQPAPAKAAALAR